MSISLSRFEEFGCDRSEFKVTLPLPDFTLSFRNQLGFAKESRFRILALTTLRTRLSTLLSLVNLLALALSESQEVYPSH